MEEDIITSLYSERIDYTIILDVVKRTISESEGVVTRRLKPFKKGD
jgi:hypothetical protein